MTPRFSADDNLVALTKPLNYKKLFAKPSDHPKPALFLDRDGVVIEDCHYLCKPEHVRLCTGALKLISAANRSRWPVVLVTNQSGISRDYFTWHDVENVNARMVDLLGPDARLSAIYANGHGPTALPFTWRKPSPLMITQASIDLNIDLKHSVLIGDRLTDLQAGAAAHLSMVFHVLSGHGRKSRQSVLDWYHGCMIANSVDSPDASCNPTLELLDTLEQFPVSVFRETSVPSQ